jgi:hypothetical protein
MKPINKLELSVIINDPGKLVKLQHNGDQAINSKISFKFGQKKCQFLATAYNEIAETISKLPSDTEVVIEGALYQEKYQDKTTGEFKSVDKIRITKVKEFQDNFHETSNDYIF